MSGDPGFPYRPASAISDRPGGRTIPYAGASFSGQAALGSAVQALWLLRALREGVSNADQHLPRQRWSLLKEVVALARIEQIGIGRACHETRTAFAAIFPGGVQDALTFEGVSGPANAMEKRVAHESGRLIDEFRVQRATANPCDPPDPDPQGPEA